MNDDYRAGHAQRRPDRHRRGRRGPVRAARARAARPRPLQPSHPERPAADGDGAGRGAGHLGRLRLVRRAERALSRPAQGLGCRPAPVGLPCARAARAARREPRAHRPRERHDEPPGLRADDGRAPRRAGRRRPARRCAARGIDARGRPARWRACAPRSPASSAPTRASRRAKTPATTSARCAPYINDELQHARRLNAALADGTQAAQERFASNANRASASRPGACGSGSRCWRWPSGPWPSWGSPTASGSTGDVAPARLCSSRSRPWRRRSPHAARRTTRRSAPR